MIIADAFAQAAGGPAGPSLIGSLMPLVLIFVVFYFLLIRPQQKKQKDHRAMLEAVGKGDKIITGGGIFGEVTKTIGEHELDVKIAKDVTIRVLRGSIMNLQDNVKNNALPAKANDNNKNSDNKNSQKSKSTKKPAAKKKLK